MNDHSELLEDAREMATNCGPDSRWHVGHEAIADALRKLANIVEEHDNQPILTENLKALRAQLDDLDRRIGQQDEAVAACRTCEDVITAYQNTPTNQSGPGSAAWIRLKAARHLAKRAADNTNTAKGGE